MKIRKSTINDKKEFLEVQKEAFPNLNLKRQTEYFKLKIKNNEIFSIFEGNNYVGHIGFGNYSLVPPFSGGVFIEELAVKKYLRGKGYGTHLINSLIGYCKKNKIHMIYLGTGDYKKNKNISYYKKLGFKIIGNLKEINPKSEYKYGQIFLGKVVK